MYQHLIPVINLFCTNIIIIISIYSAGYFFLNQFQVKKFFGLILISGVIITSILSLFINFFLPIDYKISFIIIFILFIYFLKLNKYKADLLKIIIISFLSIFFYYAGNNAEDFSIYHLINIQAIIENKIILGLIKIKLNLGQSPISFYGDAIFQSLPFIKTIINYMSFITFVGLISFLIEIIKSKKHYYFSEYFLIISTLYVVLKFSRLGSHGADLISLVLILCGIYFFLNINFKKINQEDNFNNIFYTLTFISSAIFFKIFSITYYLLFFLILFFLIKRKQIKKYYKLIFTIITFNLFFLLKNFLISGCLIFPIQETCFNNFLWSSDNYTIYNWKLINEAWSKGWYDHFSKNYYEYIKNLYWLNTWFNNHFIKSLEKFFIPIILIIILIKKLKRKTIYRNNINFNIIIVFFVSFLSVTLWFFNSPLTRLGLIGLIPLIILILNFKFLRNFKFTLSTNTISFIIILIPIFFLTKNTYRIYNTSSDYENFPYPRINKNEIKNVDNKKVKVKQENGVKFYIYDKEKCFTIKFPCLPKYKEKKFLFLKKYNYIILKNL